MLRFCSSGLSGRRGTPLGRLGVEMLMEGGQRDQGVTNAVVPVPDLEHQCGPKVVVKIARQMPRRIYPVILQRALCWCA